MMAQRGEIYGRRRGKRVPCRSLDLQVPRSGRLGVLVILRDITEGVPPNCSCATPTMSWSGVCANAPPSSKSATPSPAEIQERRRAEKWLAEQAANWPLQRRSGAIRFGRLPRPSSGTPAHGGQLYPAAQPALSQPPRRRWMSSWGSSWMEPCACSGSSTTCSPSPGWAAVAGLPAGGPGHQRNGGARLPAGRHRRERRPHPGRHPAGGPWRPHSDGAAFPEPDRQCHQVPQGSAASWSIDARREDALWRIDVCDDGIGIDPRFSERIFVIFQRLHTAADYRAPASRAICKKIVEPRQDTSKSAPTPARGHTSVSHYRPGGAPMRDRPIRILLWRTT